MLHVEIKDTSFEWTGSRLVIPFADSRAIADTFVPYMKLEDIISNLSDKQKEKLCDMCAEALQKTANEPSMSDYANSLFESIANATRPQLV